MTGPAAVQTWHASVRSAKDGAARVEVVPDGAAPPVPDDHGNPVPVSFRLAVAGGSGPAAKIAVIVGSSEPRPIKLQLRVHDDEGQPLRSLPFELKAAGKSVTGETTADGLVEVSFQRAPEAQLTVQGEKAHVFRLQLGKLEAPETPLGAQQRLQSLGYDLRATGKLDDGTKKALAAFRAHAGLPEGSALDAGTAEKIDQEYRREMQGD